MSESRLIELLDGSFDSRDSWVYVWTRRDTGEVIYVGATGLPLEVRTWLHLNDDDPTIGRVRSEHPEAMTGAVQVHGFPVPPGIDRQAVRRAVVALTKGAAPFDAVDSEVPALAETIIASLDKRGP